MTGFARGLAAVALVTAFVVPAPGIALHGGATAECEGTTFMDSESSWFGDCESTFELGGSGFVSDIETHGNYHVADLATTGRTVSLFWRDAAGHTVFVADCTITGLSAGGAGPLDLMSALCEREYVSLTYAPGVQTLTVAAVASGTIDPGPFHGRIVISPDSALF